MSTDTETPDTLAAKFGVTAVVSPIAARLDQPASAWDRDARHFAVSLLRGGEGMTTYYSQGSAHTVDPTAGEVLHSLLMDASYLEDSGEPVTVELVRAVDANTAALRAMFTEDEWEVLQQDAAEVEW